METINKDNQQDFFGAIKDYLETMGVKYDLQREKDQAIITIRMNTKNVPVLELLMLVNSNGEVTERINIFKGVKDLDSVFPMINRLNERYKLAKFVLDDDHDIMIYREEGAASEATVGWAKSIVLTAYRLFYIADDSLNEIMSVMWGRRYENLKTGDLASETISEIDQKTDDRFCNNRSNGLTNGIESQYVGAVSNTNAREISVEVIE